MVGWFLLVHGCVDANWKNSSFWAPTPFCHLVEDAVVLHFCHLTHLCFTVGVSRGAAAQRSQSDELVTFRDGSGGKMGSQASSHLLFGLVNVQKQRKEQSVWKKRSTHHGCISIVPLIMILISYTAPDVFVRNLCRSLIFFSFLAALWYVFILIFSLFSRRRMCFCLYK